MDKTIFKNLSFSRNSLNILCAMLWLIQKIFSHYHYFLYLNNWYNVQIASFRIFWKKLYFKRSKTWKKKFAMKKCDTNELRQPTSWLIPWWIPFELIGLPPKKKLIFFTYLLFSRLTLSNVIFLEITTSFVRMSCCFLWS